MPTTICIANQKGGVGKTTTAINLSAALATAGKTTLLIDLDPQCNATSGLGRRPVDEHALLSSRPLRLGVSESDVPGLFLLPGSRAFRDVDFLASADEARERQLLAHLQEGTGLFDYVVIDCPPSLGRLTKLALAASDEVLMPIQCEFFAMEGLTQMIEVIRSVMLTKQGQLEFAGILLTMYDHELELTKEVEDQVREFFGEIVFESVIPRDVAVSEAPSHGQSVLDYAPRSRGSRAYVELGMEVLYGE
jgi:chromosome partitioning protein